MEDKKFAQMHTVTKSAFKILEAKEVTDKNRKAAILTIVSASLIFLISFTVKLPPTPIPDPPIVDKYVDVTIDDNINLGNDANGALGKIQPLMKGDFSPPQQVDYNVSKPLPQQYEAPADPATNERQTEDVAEVPKPRVKPPVVGRVMTSNNNPPRQNAPIHTTPAPRPRAAMGTPRPGGTGQGNGADRDNGFKNQGNGNGNGDAGNPFGTPNGTGQRLSNANLKNNGEIERLTSQSGTNYKGKVTLKLRVDENGSVTSVLSASPSPYNSEAKSFANQVAYKMKFPSGADGRNATIVLDFDY